MEEIDLKDIFSMFWTRKYKILIIILISVIIGAVYSLKFIQPLYTSSTTIVLATSDDSVTMTDLTLNSNLMSTYRELVKSKNVIGRVINDLSLDIDEESLRKSIDVTAVANSEMIKISVTNEDPEFSAKVANKLALVFTEKVKEYYNMDNVHVLDYAKKSETPSNINHTKDIIKFGVVGVVLAVVYVIGANLFDTTIKSPQEVERDFKVPVLATIPFNNNGKNKGGKK